MANPIAPVVATAPQPPTVEAAPSVPYHQGSAGPDRADVVRAAVDLIDQWGLRGFTGRKLADQLGVPVTTLRRLFRTRGDLLDAIAESIVGELHADPEVQPATGEWQEYLQRVAYGVRRIALRHPHVFPLLATRPLAIPWLQPPLRSLRWLETFLETLHRCGFSDRAAVGAYRAFCSFLLGHLLLEVTAVEPAPWLDLSMETGVVQPGNIRDYPRLSAVTEELTRDYAEDEFGEALECLLDRLESQGIA
ncbi:AcrR family transcriptional regulator [Nakamurella sp. UYEF19]|uniref:TetR/AcrR family transcriptional regulator C-terminal domain-containing protein n=1 Tax=Nakamurella sp. UYEF19 TaxID=1756392 RepID=UPI0033974622